MYSTHPEIIGNAWQSVLYPRNPSNPPNKILQFNCALGMILCIVCHLYQSCVRIICRRSACGRFFTRSFPSRLRINTRQVYRPPHRIYFYGCHLSGRPKVLFVFNTPQLSQNMDYFVIVSIMLVPTLYFEMNTLPYPLMDYY